MEKTRPNGKMKKKVKGTSIIIILFVVLVAIIGVAAFLLVDNKKTIENYRNSIADMALEIEMNKQTVYVATDDLTKGTVIEEGVNVELQENVTALPSEFYISELDLGKTLLVDVSAYEPVMASMVTSEIITKDTREYEVGIANLMLDQQVNDYVDIRIMFPTGEDYIVCSKLKVKKLALEDCIFYTNLNENEILTLASATIDAYTITGTKIYLTRYVEDNLQEEAIPNYPVRSDTLSLIATDPNILEIAQQTLNYSARMAMEANLSKLTEEQLQSIADGHGIVDTAHNSAMVSQQATAGEITDETEGAITNE